MARRNQGKCARYCLPFPGKCCALAPQIFGLLLHPTLASKLSFGDIFCNRPGTPCYSQQTPSGTIVVSRDGVGGLFC
jgi:hypothetical protein